MTGLTFSDAPTFEMCVYANMTINRHVTMTVCCSLPPSAPERNFHSPLCVLTILAMNVIVVDSSDAQSQQQQQQKQQQWKYWNGMSTTLIMFHL